MSTLPVTLLSGVCVVTTNYCHLSIVTWLSEDGEKSLPITHLQFIKDVNIVLVIDGKC